ncbi:MAG: chromate transporter [Saprospiraceae bacterium]|jgi:chromate transporter
MEKPVDETNNAVTNPSFREATKLWWKIGLLSFGGPAAQIALMHKLIVDQMRWMSEKEYLNALSFCMLLPGPEAMQIATYAGWRQHGTVGGLIAGLLFVLPGAFVILAMAIIYAYFGNVPFIQALFLGVKAAVLIVVVEALLKISKRALKGLQPKVIAVLAFIGIFLLNVPFPLIVLIAGLYGFFTARQSEDPAMEKVVKPQGFSGLLTTVVIMLLIWWLPLVLIDQLFHTQIISDIGIFFSKLAVVTFGGAYAVLAYMGQDVVNHWGWLSAGEMMDGLGLAETTPGPLILVTEFVGFLAAFREGGLALGLAGAAVTLWVTFVPCFLWIFAGAPYIDWIGDQPKLKGALEAISAAVVGVILNLSVWFSLHVIFSDVAHKQLGVLTLWVPNWSSIDWTVVSLTALCGVLAFKLHWSIVKILLLSALLGLAQSYF